MRNCFIYTLCFILVLITSSCSVKNKAPLSGVKPDLAQVSIATGSYIVSQTTNKQEISIPIFNNSGAPVTVAISSALMSAANPLVAHIGTCGDVLQQNQMCYIKVHLNPGSVGSGQGSVSVLINNTLTLTSVINWIRLNKSLNVAELYAPSTPLVASPGQIVYASLTFANTASALNDLAAAIVTPVVAGGVWTIVQDQCGANIPSNGLCSIIISFKNNTTTNVNLTANKFPAATFSKGGALTGLYVFNAPNEGVSQLAGIPAIINLYNQPDQNIVLTVTNSGNIPITDFAISNTSGISVDYSSCRQVIPLDPFNQETCTLTISLNNDAQGYQSITISYSDFNGVHTQDSTIDYDSLQIVSPTPLIFNSIINTPVAANFTLQNLGTNLLTVQPAITSSTNQFGTFALSLPNGNTLAAGDSLSATTTFTPSVSAQGFGILTVTATDSDGNTLPQSMSFVSNVFQAPIVNSNTEQLNFQLTTVNTSNTLNFTLTNTGSVALTNLVPLTQLPSGFVLTNNCNGSIAPQAACIFTMTYTPTTYSPTIRSLELEFSYNYIDPVTAQSVSASSGNLIDISYSSTLTGPHLVCNTAQSSINIGTTYFSDPQSNISTNVVCINNGQDAAIVNWDNLTPNNTPGYTITANGSSTSPINVSAGGNLTFVIAATPATVNGASPLIKPTITYTGANITDTATAQLAAQISYSTVAWYTASILSSTSAPCNNATCTIIITNNSPDSLPIANPTLPAQITSTNPCSNVSGQSTCNITFSLNSAGFVSLSTGGIQNYPIVIQSSASSTLSYTFNTSANGILYIGGEFVNNGSHSNYLLYYQPFVSTTLGTYCYTGVSSSGKCNVNVANNNTVLSLLNNPQNGGLFIGTRRTPGTPSGGAVFSYTGNGLQVAQNLGIAAGASTSCGNDGTLTGCSITSMALTTNNGTIPLSLVVATALNFFIYNTSTLQWQPYTTSNIFSSTSINPIITAVSGLGGINNGLAATGVSGGNGFTITPSISGANPASWTTVQAIPTGSSITALNAGVNSTSNNYLFFGANQNLYYNYLNAATIPTLIAINGITSGEIINNIQFIAQQLLVITTTTGAPVTNNIYFASAPTAGTIPALSKITATMPSNIGTITEIAVDNNGDIYFASSTGGNVYKITNTGTLSAPIYSSTPTPIAPAISSPNGVFALNIGYAMSWAQQ